MPDPRTASRLTANCTCTIMLAFFVALLFPVGYFVLGYQYATGSLETEAAMTAQLVAEFIEENPRLWRLNRDELQMLIAQRYAGRREVRRILDRRGTEVVTSGESVPAPIIRRKVALFGTESLAGSIQIERSLRPLLKETAVVALLGLGIGALVFILLPFRAISRANAKLKDSYLFLTRVMESSTNAVIVVNLDGTIEMVNGRCVEMGGYSREELYGNHIGRLFCGCTGEEVFQELDQVTRGASDMVKFEADLQRKDGSSLTISCGAAPIHQEGEIAGVVLSVEDITEYRQAVEQLRRSKDYTEDLIQAANVIIIGLDLAGVVTLINRTAEEVTGYPAHELTGQNLFQGVLDQESFPEMCLAANADEEQAAREAFVNQITTKSGAPRAISWRNSAIVEDGRVVGTLCFGIDITEHRKMEALLRQTQKMESLGQLAGGVAHDFNNMLSVILGYAQLCRTEVEQGGTLSLYLQEVIKAGERSRDMVRQLLAFSRQGAVSPRAIDLNAHCQEIVKTIGMLLGEEISLNLLQAEARCPVRMDPHQVDQLLINLAVNARDAMPCGGRLTIRTENASIEEEFCAYHLAAKPGEYACLSVEDTGVGMESEMIKQIFEPFFTTKEAGKGTGLGLATVYGIVTQNGGFIEVESTPGHGATFRIYLPRQPESDSAAVAPQTAADPGALLAGANHLPLPAAVRHVPQYSDEDFQGAAPP